MTALPEPPPSVVQPGPGLSCLFILLTSRYSWFVLSPQSPRTPSHHPSCWASARPTYWFSWMLTPSLEMDPLYSKRCVSVSVPVWTFKQHNVKWPCNSCSRSTCSIILLRGGDWIVLIAWKGRNAKIIDLTEYFYDAAVWQPWFRQTQLTEEWENRKKVLLCFLEKLFSCFSSLFHVEEICLNSSKNKQNPSESAALARCVWK